MEVGGGKGNSAEYHRLALGTGIAYLVSNSSVKPRAILGVAAITVLVIVTTLLLSRHFRLAELAHV